MRLKKQLRGKNGYIKQRTRSSASANGFNAAEVNGAMSIYSFWGSCLVCRPGPEIKALELKHLACKSRRNRFDRKFLLVKAETEGMGSSWPGFWGASKSRIQFLFKKQEGWAEADLLRPTVFISHFDQQWSTASKGCPSFECICCFLSCSVRGIALRKEKTRSSSS